MSYSLKQQLRAVHILWSKGPLATIILIAQLIGLVFISTAIFNNFLDYSYPKFCTLALI